MKKRKLGYLSAAPRVSTRPEAELGGPRSHVLGVIHAFDRLGWQVTPFIVGDRVPIRWITKGSIKSLQRNRIRLALADLTRVGMGILSTFRAWLQVGSEVDLVYERFAAFQALGWIFKRHGIFWILETNAPLFIESKHDRQTIFFSSLAKYLEVRAYKACDKMVCVSDTLKEIIVEFVGISPNKIIVIPNGVDTTFFDPSLYPPHKNLTGFTIGFVGSFIAWQGLDLLFEVTRELKAAGIEVNLLLVGDGPARQELEEKAHRLKLNGNVQFVGYVSREEVPAYIAGIDIGYSGQIPLKMGKMYLSPLKLYEYMAMAKPVIASDFEDARRVIEDRKTGYLFEAGKPADLRRAILTAYQNRSQLPGMGVEARATVVGNHSWEARISHLISSVENKQKCDVENGA